MRLNKKGMCIINTWITKEEKGVIRKASSSDDISMSKWLRRAIKEKLERDGVK